MKCDLHVHSSRSFDSRLTLSRITARAAKAGLDAVAITNHNCTLPPEAYLRAAGPVRLIPGAEYSTEVGHVLALFLSEPIEEQGVMPDETGRYHSVDVLSAVHRAGGLCILAHPFASGRTPTGEIIALFDGVEGCNSRAAYARKGQANAMARAAAGALPQTAGSDAHLLREIGRSYCEVPCPATCTAAEFAAALPRAVLHCRPTSPAASAQSQLIKAWKLRRPGLVPRAIFKLGYGGAAALFPRLFGITPDRY